MSRINRPLLLALMLLLVLLPASAQTPLGTLVNYWIKTEGADVVNVEAYFNITDGQRVLPDVEVAEVNVQLDDGTDQTVPAFRPQGPIYIAILLDASGSMTSANPAMREAAKQAVDAATDSAQFAVISFSDQNNINILQEFSPDKGLTARNIDRVQSIQDGGTCLYDAAVTAIDLIDAQPPGRRAIILFTDGVDEITQDGPPCSQNRLDDVLRLATAPDTRVPIYAVGMVGRNGSRINEGELNRIARDTSGLVSIGAEADLGSMFETIMNALNNQWAARAGLYPSAGRHSVTMVPILSDGSRAPSFTFSFDVSRDFTPPMVLLADSVTYNEARDVTTITLRGEGFDRATSLDVRVTDQGSIQQYAEVLNGVPTQIEIPGGTLLAGEDYTATINGLDAAGQPTMPEPLLVSFVYNPPPEIPITPIQAGIVRLRLSEGQVNVQFSVTGADRVARLEFDIINAETSATEATVQAEAVNREINLDTSGLMQGAEYIVRITPYDLNGQPVLDGLGESSFTLGAPRTLPTILIDGVNHQSGTRDVSVDLIVENAESVAALEVSLVNSETGARVLGPEIYDGTPATIDIPTENLSRNVGYQIRIRPVDNQNQQFYAEPVVAEFVYSPPGKTLVDRIADFAGSPLVLAFLLALAAIVVFFFWNSRREKLKAQTAGTTSYINASKTTVQRVEDTIGRRNQVMTDKIQVPQMDRTELDRPAPPAAVGMPPVEQQKTEVLPHTPPPTGPARPPAQVRILRAKTQIDPPVLTLSGPSLTIGRERSQINFDKDVSVSRSHLEIFYSDRDRAYVARDLGSTHGTKINGVPLPKGGSQPLGPGTIRIELGQTVVLEFSVTGNPTAPASDWSPF